MSMMVFMSVAGYSDSLSFVKTYSTILDFGLDGRMAGRTHITIMKH